MTRTRARQNSREPDDGNNPVSDLFVASLGQAGVLASLPGRIEGEPFGGGVETDVSSQDWVEALSETVPLGRQGELDEAALDIPANAEGMVSVAGLRFGPFSGLETVTVPFDGASLVEGDRVLVRVRSTDGESATAKAQITGRLF